jgi:hypothetical protein
MLQIKNLNKIVGQHLYIKWLPKTEGWAVRAVEEIGDTYIFELINTQNGTWRQAEIQLRRETKLDPNDFTIKWELWAWNLENGKPEQIWCKMNCMNTTSEMGLRLGMILERILPTMK